MKIKFSLVFIFFAQLLNAQQYTLIQQKCFGGNNAELYPYCVLKDNSLYVVGTTRSQNSGDVTDSLCDFNPITSTVDLWYLKTDLNFNILNQRNIGGNRIDNLGEIKVSMHLNRLVLFSSTNSDSSCSKSVNLIGSDDLWVIEIDTLGQIISDTNYGGVSSESEPHSIDFSDSSTIVLSSSQMGGGGNQTALGYGGWDMWAFKLDKNKNVVWNKAYGGSNAETTFDAGTPYIVKQSDSTFTFISYTLSNVSGNLTQAPIGFGDIWFVYCDTSGNILTQKRFGGIEQERPCRIINTKDHGFLILSTTASPVGFDVSMPVVGSPSQNRNIWLLKLDSLGNKQWDYRHGGSSNLDWPKWVEEAPGGGYWIASNMSPSTLNSNISEPGYGGDDIWMLKVDSLGNKVWDKRFGSTGNDRVRNFIILPDSSIIICAYADSGISGNKTVAGNGGSDYWLIHFKYTDTTSTVGFIDPIAFNESISLYPNPASDVVNIASNKTQIQNVTMYNLLGELIESKNYTSSHNIQFDLQTYPKGVYIAKITGQKNISTTRKIIKL